MQLPDLINGTFEFGGAVVNLLNVRQIVKDKVVRGINPYTYVWFTSWGVFDLYYYPHLNQMLSFYGGAAIVTVNASWLSLAAYYWIKNEYGRRKETTPRTSTEGPVCPCQGA